MFLSYDTVANHRRHKPTNRINICVALVALETPRLKNIILIFCNANAFRTGLGNRDYGHRGSAALTMCQPSILKICH
jgi:hypothetical protein